MIMKKKFKLGYTAGVFDLFHIGHLNILRKAKEQCEYLIVAVSTDELVQSYKNKTPVIRFSERMAIVESIKYVDLVIPQKSRNKMEAFDEYKFDVMFVGDDWRGDPLWNALEEDLKARGSVVSYIPYTNGISSTYLKKVLENLK